MKTYKAVLFAPDGDWVTDCRRDTIEEVIDALANRGSRWYFYLFEAIILDKGRLTTNSQRLVSVAPNLPQDFVGRSIRTLSNWLKVQSEETIYDLASL